MIALLTNLYQLTGENMPPVITLKDIIGQSKDGIATNFPILFSQYPKLATIDDAAYTGTQKKDFLENLYDRIFPAFNIELSPENHQLFFAGSTEEAIIKLKSDKEVILSGGKNIKTLGELPEDFHTYLLEFAQFLDPIEYSTPEDFPNQTLTFTEFKTPDDLSRNSTFTNFLTVRHRRYLIPDRKVLIEFLIRNQEI